MLSENAKRWVEALESGEFTQGHSRLCTNGAGYCCLGVACEVYNRENPSDKLVKERSREADWITTYDGEAHGLPPKVQKWLGVIDSSASFKGVVVDEYTTLIGLNDSGEYDFVGIANAIRENAASLFVEPVS